MRKIIILILLLFSHNLFCQTKNRISYSLGIVDLEGFTSKFSYGIPIKKPFYLNISAGHFTTGSDPVTLTMLSEKNINSFNINSEINPGIHSAKNLFYLGISGDLNILSFFKLKNHKFNIGSGVYLKRYMISNVLIEKDNMQNLYVHFLSYKNLKTISPNYYSSYEYFLKKNFSIGCSYDIILYDGGNSNALMIQFSNYF